MRSKLLVLFTVLALVLGTFNGALAQAAPDVFCGDLAEEDCAILQGSQAAMQEVAQYTFTSSFHVTLTGIPGLPAKQAEVTVSVNGVSTIDEAALAANQALVGLTQKEQLQLLADSFQPMLDLVGGWDLELTVNMAVSPELAAAFSAQFGSHVPDSLGISGKLVDGVLYWNATDLAALDQSITAGWVGYPLLELLTMFEEQGAYDQIMLLADPAALAADDGWAAPYVILVVVQMLQANPDLFQPFVTVERGDDVKLAEQTGATFVTTFDAAAFLTSPEFQQIVIDLANAGVFESTGFSATFIAGNVPVLGVLGPKLLTGISATATTTIVLDGFHLHQREFELVWDMADVILTAENLGLLPPEPQPANYETRITVGAIVSYYNFAAEATRTIKTPNGAAMISLENLLSGAD